jgi:hypothetical protein
VLYFLFAIVCYSNQVFSRPRFMFCSEMPRIAFGLAALVNCREVDGYYLPRPFFGLYYLLTVIVPVDQIVSQVPQEALS